MKLANRDSKVTLNCTQAIWSDLVDLNLFEDAFKFDQHGMLLSVNLNIDITNGYIESLPESFDQLRVGGRLDLSYNELTSFRI